MILRPPHVPLFALTLMLVTAPEAGAQIAIDTPKAEILFSPGAAPAVARRASGWSADSLRTGLLAGYVGLQVADIASTLRALDGGRAREANPVMGGLSRRPATFIAVKSAGAIATATLLHKYAKRHPRAAFFITAALDGVYSVAVARNLQQRR